MRGWCLQTWTGATWAPSTASQLLAKRRRASASASRMTPWMISMSPTPSSLFSISTRCPKLPSLSRASFLTVCFLLDCDKSEDEEMSFVETWSSGGLRAEFSLRTCVFFISAWGPADPDVRVLPSHGAKCAFQVQPGRGENYFVR